MSAVVGDTPEAAMLALLAARAAEATVCPSEVARALAAASGTDWRDEMPRVHAATDRLVAAGTIRLSWRGAMLAEREGPYRIGRGSG